MKGLCPSSPSELPWPAEPEWGPSVTSPKCSLLLVDDEPVILKSLTALLSNEFEILTAESAEAAQQVFTSREVDLILTDQRMPGWTGVQLLEWVRQHSPRTVRLVM